MILRFFYIYNSLTQRDYRILYDWNLYIKDRQLDIKNKFVNLDFILQDKISKLLLLLLL